MRTPPQLSPSCERNRGGRQTLSVWLRLQPKDYNGSRASEDEKTPNTISLNSGRRTHLFQRESRGIRIPDELEHNYETWLVS